MKLINQLREESENLVEFAGNDTAKLATLVRMGLFDPSKLTLLKRALAKDNTKMTRAEKDTLLDLLDRLLEVVTHDAGTFNKVKNDVMKEETLTEDFKATKPAGDIDITKIPAIVIMHRRAIRVFPDGQKVALYWADRIGKYISVPFSSIGLSEAAKLSQDDLDKNPRLAQAIADAEVKNPPPAPKPEPTVEPEQRKKVVPKNTPYKYLRQQGMGRLASLAGAAGTAIHNKITGKTMGVKENFLEKVKRPLLEDDSSPFAYNRPKQEKAIQNTVKGNAPRRKDNVIDPYEDQDSALHSQQQAISRRANRNFASGKPMAEGVMADLKSFIDSDKSTMDLAIHNSSVSVSKAMARKLIDLHEGMNKVNQAKMETMLMEDTDSFYSLVNFALKSV